MHLFHVLCSRHQQGSHDRVPDHAQKWRILERACLLYGSFLQGQAGVGPAGVFKYCNERICLHCELIETSKSRSANILRFACFLLVGASQNQQLSHWIRKSRFQLRTRILKKDRQPGAVGPPTGSVGLRGKTNCRSKQTEFQKIPCKNFCWSCHLCQKPAGNESDPYAGGLATLVYSRDFYSTSARTLMEAESPSTLEIGNRTKATTLPYGARFACAARVLAFQPKKRRRELQKQFGMISPHFGF